MGSPSLPQQQEQEAAGDIASAVRKETTMKAAANSLLFIQIGTPTVKADDKVTPTVKEDLATLINVI